VTTSGRHLLIDEPVPDVRRLILDRPEKRNALDNALRGAIFEAPVKKRDRPFGDDRGRQEEAGA
jgi:enoyl-CoA hydratase